MLRKFASTGVYHEVLQSCLDLGGDALDKQMVLQSCLDLQDGEGVSKEHHDSKNVTVIISNENQGVGLNSEDLIENDSNENQDNEMIEMSEDDVEKISSVIQDDDRIENTNEVFDKISIGNKVDEILDNEKISIYNHAKESNFATEEKFNNYCQAVALVLFESMKQIKFTFSSKVTVMLTSMLQEFCNFQAAEKKRLFKVMESLFMLVGHYTDSDNLNELWNSLFALLPLMDYHLFELTAIWIGLRKGSRIYGNTSLNKDRNQIFQVLTSISEPVFASSDTLLKISFSKAFIHLLLSSSMNDVSTLAKPILDQYYASDDSKTTFFFYETLLERQFDFFGKIMAPYALAYLQRTWDFDSSRCLLFASSLFGDDWDSIFSAMPNSLKLGSLVRFPAQDHIRVACPISSAWTKDVAAQLSHLIKNIDIKSSQCELSHELSMLYAATKVLSNCVVSARLVEDALIHQIKTIAALLKEESCDFSSEYLSGDSHAIYKALSGHLLTQLVQLTLKTQNRPNLECYWDIVNELILPSKNNAQLLCGIADYMDGLKHCNSKLVSASELERILPLLESNVGSFQSSIRYETLRLLSCFVPVDLILGQDCVLSGPCNVFEYCLDVEVIPNDLLFSRDKAIVLRKLDALTDSKCMPKLYQDVIARYAISLLSVNFAPVWTDAIKTMVKCCHADTQAFWAVFYSVWKIVSSQHIDEPPYFKFASEAEISTSSDTIKIKNDVKRVSFICTYLDEVKMTLKSAEDQMSMPLKNLVKKFAEV